VYNEAQICLIKSDTFIPIGKVHLTVSKTLPCAMMKKNHKDNQKSKGFRY